MLWGGGSPAFNYLAIVQPQFQIQQQANQIQQQLYQQQQQIQANGRVIGADPYLPQTGRGARFGYYSHYYPTLGGGGGGPSYGGGGMTSYGGPVTPAFAHSSASQIGRSPQKPANDAGGGAPPR